MACLRALSDAYIHLKMQEERVRKTRKGYGNISNTRRLLAHAEVHYVVHDDPRSGDRYFRAAKELMSFTDSLINS